MYVPALVLLLVGTALGTPATVMHGLKANTRAMVTPKLPCCPPKQWQTVIVDLKAQTALQYATLYAYDATKKVEGSLTIPTGGSTPIYQTFTDYNTMTTYSVSMIGDPSTHKCQQTKAPHDYYDNCFGNTTRDLTGDYFLGNSSFGPAVGGIPFDGWFLIMDQLNITIALAKEECTPLLELVKGKANGNMVDSLLLFNDFSDKITTPELVTMPPACVSKNTPVVG